jgi:hypothetical protein
MRDSGVGFHRAELGEIHVSATAAGSARRHPTGALRRRAQGHRPASAALTKARTSSRADAASLRPAAADLSPGPRPTRARTGAPPDSRAAPWRDRTAAASKAHRRGARPGGFGIDAGARRKDCRHWRRQPQLPPAPATRQAPPAVSAYRQVPQAASAFVRHRSRGDTGGLGHGSGSSGGRRGRRRGAVGLASISATTPPSDSESPTLTLSLPHHARERRRHLQRGLVRFQRDQPLVL